MKKRIKKYEYFKERKESLQKLIIKYSNKIPLKKCASFVFNNYDTNSWYDHRYSIHGDAKKIFFPKCKIYKDQQYKCRPIILMPNENQKKILLGWMECCRLMYNRVIYHIRYEKFENIKSTYNWKQLRTYVLKDIKQKLSNDFDCPAHIIDCSIKRVCAMYKSALTNQRNNNINKFNIKYLNKNSSKILEIEKDFFFKSGFCKKTLGKIMKNNQENFDYNSIAKDCLLNYNQQKDIFTLFIPEIAEYEIINNRDKYVSIDPGIRTFLTCLGENQIDDIGTTIQNNLSYQLKRQDRIKRNYSKNTGKKFEKIINEKIRNKITDLHWKTINYLTKKYNTILIGKWSTKEICKNGKSCLNKITKRIAQKLRYYEFLQKLEYKCKLRGVRLRVVKEHYTSKTCSKCGEINETSLKVYNCDRCGKIDRDLNGCRNILLKGKYDKSSYE